MFDNYENILSLPDIPNWDTSSAIDMGFRFSNNKSLTKLPDLSKWNTSNVSSMKG